MGLEKKISWPLPSMRKKDALGMWEVNFTKKGKERKGVTLRVWPGLGPKTIEHKQSKVVWLQPPKET